MVYNLLMEKPYFLMDDLGGNTNIFEKTPIFTSLNI